MAGSLHKSTSWKTRRSLRSFPSRLQISATRSRDTLDELQRLSKTTTEYFAGEERRLTIVWEPMYPQPPVMRMQGPPELDLVSLILIA